MSPLTEVALADLPRDRVGELLTLQRAAYVSEAQLYADPSLPAHTQSLDDLLAELRTSICLAAFHGQRLVGAVRAQEVAAVLHIGRLTVAPDLQGRGIGSRLLAAVELRTQLSVATLFTGHLSVDNIRLYARNGYRETHREQLKAGVQLVHMSKHLVRPT